MRPRAAGDRDMMVRQPLRMPGLSDYPDLADILVVTIIGLSALVGFIRGFVREVLSIGGLDRWPASPPISVCR